jgi:hypothetical protein
MLQKRNRMQRALYRNLILASLLLCTASCKDVTHIQDGYISSRNDCHSRAEYGVSHYIGDGGSVSGKDKNNLLLQMFCECMKDQDWSVAGCKLKDKDFAKAAAPTSAQQPTIVVVQAPPPPAAAVAPAPAPAAEPAACPTPPKGKKRPKRKPSGVCPAPEEYGQTELDKVLNKE